jgi:O-succinylbenzoic acid--CoA ligase
MVLREFIDEWNSSADSMLVHTSGSTGRPKPVWVEKRRMEASARNTCSFLGLHRGDKALLCMSLDYIAGKMMAVRSIVCGLQLICVEPNGHPMRHVTEQIDLAAMVPLQVYNTLQVAKERERLMAVRHLLIGGGGIDAAMEAQLKAFPHAVWSTYGMTETLSHIALRRLNGADASEWYTPFAGVSVSLDADGCLIIDAPQICGVSLVTNDRAVVAPDGRRFRIIGRKDNVICSGGVKIQIEEVESLLKPLLQMPFLVTKCKDAKFGERPVLLVVSRDIAEVQRVCAAVLPKYWQPRTCLPVDALPLTPTGKPARAAAEQMAAAILEQ